MSITAMKQALEASKDECKQYAIEQVQEILEQAIAEAESKRAALDAIIKSSEKRNEEWHALSADEQSAYHAQNACPYCGGSGHKDDIAKAEKQEPVAWRDLTNDEMFALCRDIQSGKHTAYDILWEVSTRLKARNHPQPKREPLTFGQVEDCFPKGPSVFEDPYGDKQTSPRWLHAFARAIEAAHHIKE